MNKILDVASPSFMDYVNSNEIVYIIPIVIIIVLTAWVVIKIVNKKKEVKK